MKNLTDLFKKLRRLDLSKQEVYDSLYRISDWLIDEEHSVEDSYVQNQFEFLEKLVSSAEKNSRYFFVNSVKSK